MTCRITWYFVDRTSSIADGWTENFYSAAGNSATALDQSTAPIFFNKRRAILARDYQITKVRAVNVANRFDTSVKRYSNNQGRGSYTQPGRGVGVNISEQPWDRLLVRLVAGTVTARSFALGGIPTLVIADTLDYRPDPAFAAALESWAEDLSEPTTAYQIRRLALDQTIVNPTTITLTPDKRGLVLTWPGGQPGIVVRRDLIKLTGIQNATPVNGLWRVQSIDINTWTLYPRRRTIYGSPTTCTLLEKMVYAYSSITDFEPIRGMERKTGRPSEVLRGRARGRQG